MEVYITDFGAKGDGRTKCHEAVQRAIDACCEAGGGVVRVPAGNFLCGTIFLKSHITLYLESGSCLTGSLEPEDIFDFARNTNDPNEDIGWEGGCFICAFHEKDITIAGEGTIYGQGDKVFYDDGADGEYHECPKNARLLDRPRTTFFEDVENLTIRGITFRDAAFWTLHMAGCRHVVVDGIRILNDGRGVNNDGIDPDTCRDVVISNCIIKTGDDAIVVKNSAPMAEKYGVCENVVIRGCVLYSHSSALKIGTETVKGIRYVLMSDCLIRGCSRGVGIWVRDGACIEHIHVHHITGDVRRYADCPGRDFAPRWWGKGEPIFISATPRRENEHPGSIRHIAFDHIDMEAESCIFIAGEAESPIHDVALEDLSIRIRPQGTQESGMFDEQPSVRALYPHAIPALYARSVVDLRAGGSILREAPYTAWPKVVLTDCENAKIDLDICE